MPASVKAFSKARRWLSVSTVPPDLLDTTTTVSASRSSSALRTKSGSDESTTVSSTPAAPQMTSGASDEPPMPQSATWGSPASRNSTWSAAISSTSGRDVSDRSTQASRLADSSSASGPQSVWSPIGQPARDPVVDQLLDAGREGLLVGVAEVQLERRPGLGPSPCTVFQAVLWPDSLMRSPVLPSPSVR